MAQLTTSQSQQLNSLNVQLDNIASCLNYDQSEICQLFQQKYQELILEHHQQAAQ